MHNYIPSLSAKPEMNKPLLIASYLPPGISYTRAEFQSVLNQNQNLLNTDLSIFLGICNMVRYWTIGFGLFSDYFPAVKISSLLFCILFFPPQVSRSIKPSFFWVWRVPLPRTLNPFCQRCSITRHDSVTSVFLTGFVLIYSMEICFCSIFKKLDPTKFNRHQFLIDMLPCHP
jgi:hypothetical protein